MRETYLRLINIYLFITLLFIIHWFHLYNKFTPITKLNLSNLEKNILFYTSSNILRETYLRLNALVFGFLFHSSVQRKKNPYSHGFLHVCIWIFFLRLLLLQRLVLSFLFCFFLRWSYMGHSIVVSCGLDPLLCICRKLSIFLFFFLFCADIFLSLIILLLTIFSTRRFNILMPPFKSADDAIFHRKVINGVPSKRELLRLINF